MPGRTITKLLVGLVVLLAAFFVYRYLFVSSAPAAEIPGLQTVGEAAGPPPGGGAGAAGEIIPPLPAVHGGTH